VADIDPCVGEQVLHLELKHLLVDVDVAMDLGFPDQVADGFDVAAVSIHRHLRIVALAVSLNRTLLPGNAAARTFACNCEEFATALPALAYALNPRVIASDLGGKVN
jgi:hypothetical protein